jgi:hypothetical protein
LDLLTLVLASQIVLAALVLVLIFLLILLLKMLRKANSKLIQVWKMLKKIVVTVTVVAVKTDQSSYAHGATVQITGSVTTDGKPQASETVNLKITDPSGAETDLPDATTASDGTFAASWDVPPDAVPGTYTLEATAKGMTNTVTFTFNTHT